MSRRVLLIYAHPAASRSRANQMLLAAAAETEDVTVHDLYATYPDLFIDPGHERALVDVHDALVFQHPFYWYSAPSLLKEWLDLVLTHGYAYGKGGEALAGKPWLQAVTTGASRDAYAPTGHNRFSVEELLRPFEASATLCQCRWEEPFVVYASHMCSPTELQGAAQRYRTRLRALTHNLVELRGT